MFSMEQQSFKKIEIDFKAYIQLITKMYLLSYLSKYSAIAPLTALEMDPIPLIANCLTLTGKLLVGDAMTRSLFINSGR